MGGVSLRLRRLNCRLLVLGLNFILFLLKISLILILDKLISKFIRLPFLTVICKNQEMFSKVAKNRFRAKKGKLKCIWLK